MATSIIYYTGISNILFSLNVFYYIFLNTLRPLKGAYQKLYLNKYTRLKLKTLNLAVIIMS